MTDPLIVVQLPLWPADLLPPKKPLQSSYLHGAWQCPQTLPNWVSDSPPVMRVLDLLGALPWHDFPERDLQRHWCQTPIPYASLAAALLVKLNEGLRSMGHLRRYLLEHPAFIWLLGFPLVPAPNHPLGFNARRSLPSQRHLTAMLRQVPNSALQFVLAQSVQLILNELSARARPPIDCVSLDTKHIIAWVKENNPKAYVAERFKKDKQPSGDPDCKLGCKRRRNQSTPRAIPYRRPRCLWANTTGAMARALS